jgi:hypothetical protein
MSNHMLRWPRANVRESTIQTAVRKMAEALHFYADADWNGDYPGGIDVGDSGLDFGYRAQRILKDRYVRRALESIDAE